MQRAVPALATLVALGLAGCPGPQKPYARVRAFAAPQDAAGSFAILFHPWSVDAAGKATAKDAELLAPVADVTLSCANARCQTSETSVLVEAAPVDGKPVEVVVEKAGFAPTKFTFEAKPGQREILVLLRPAGAP